MGFKIRWKPRPDPIFRVGDWVTLKDDKWTTLSRTEILAYQVSDLRNEPGLPSVYLPYIEMWVPTNVLKVVTNDSTILKMKHKW